MLCVQQDTPLYVPLLFLSFGLVLVFLHRHDFRNPDRMLQRMAEKRAKSRIVRLLGGSGDVSTEYESLRKDHWLFPVILVLYFAGLLAMLAVALFQR